MTDWSYSAAHAAEYARVIPRLRIVGIVVLGIGLLGGEAAAATVYSLGARTVGQVLFVAAPVVVGLAVRRYLTTAVAPLIASALVGTWLAKEGLIDPDGRLTEAALYLATDPPPEGAGAEERERSRALAAYSVARERSLAGRRDWLDPFVEVAPELDTSEIRAALQKQSRLRLPRWAWVLVAPLAVVGAALLVLSILFWIVSLLGW